MNDLIATKQTALKILCLRFGVRKLDLFGSATSERFDPDTSDLDFVVDFADESPGFARRFFEFQTELSRLFGVPVELITERSIRNPYFRASVDASRVTVYESPNRQAAA